jgi:hypothetical protein
MVKGFHSKGLLQCKELQDTQIGKTISCKIVIPGSLPKLNLLYSTTLVIDNIHSMPEAIERG